MSSKEPSLQEQAELFIGADKWRTKEIKDAGLRSLMMADGPNGLRIETGDSVGFRPAAPAVAYPTLSALGCTFDKALMYRFGQVLADECIRDGVDILLGPGINHKRSPRCGRNFEYFSEDPILSSELAIGYVQGLQSCGIASCVKHFAANSRETGRLVQDSVVDERTLQEIYLYQFERVVKQARPWSIMAAYNQLNGAYCCENEELLKNILRKQWGYDGTVISDWGGVSDPLQSAKNGLNIEMPGPDHGTSDALLEGIQKGILSEGALQESTAYIRKLVERCSHKTDRDPEVDHFAFAQELAERSAVLLKNEGILPLRQERIAVIGAFAEYPRYQGAGSSKVRCLSVDSLKEALEEAGIPFIYAQGYRTDSDDSDPALIKEALEAAEQCSTVVLMLGLPDGKEAEGFDRPHLSLPENQNRLVEHILQVNRNVVVVLQCGAPVTVPWADEVRGILLMYLSGCRGGHALKRLLYGEVNPSGKLAETFPLREEDVPCEPYFDNDLLQVQYREGIFTGYRYYSTFHKEVRWPFGYGLSYTSFRYDGFKVYTDHDRLYAETTLTNTGAYAGRETVQIYVSIPDSRIARPLIELKGFTAVELAPGETRTVVTEIPLEDMKYWDVQAHSRRTEEGQYVLYAASSSQDLRLSAGIHLDGTQEPYSTLTMKRAETEEEFIHMLDHPLPVERKAYPFHRNTTIHELGISRMGRMIHRAVYRYFRRHDPEDIVHSTVFESPLRSMLMGSTRFTWKTVDEAADLLNGHILGSVGRILRSMQPKKKS